MDSQIVYPVVAIIVAGAVAVAYILAGGDGRIAIGSITTLYLATLDFLGQNNSKHCRDRDG